MKYILVATIIIMIFVFIFLLGNIPIGFEPLTELFFENHSDLPKYIKPDDYYYFVFSINNLEYKTMKYTYEVTTEFRGKSKTIKKDFIYIDHDKKETIREKYSLPRKFKRAKIEVKLLEKKQSIHFWVDEQ